MRVYCSALLTCMTKNWPLFNAPKCLLILLHASKAQHAISLKPQQTNAMFVLYLRNPLRQLCHKRLRQQALKPRMFNLTAAAAVAAVGGTVPPTFTCCCSLMYTMLMPLFAARSAQLCGPLQNAQLCSEPHRLDLNQATG